MKLLWTPQGWEDYRWWQDNDRSTLARINALLDDLRRHPFTGIGKPEPLRNQMSGWWSRRITGEHRLVYRVSGKADEQRAEIAQCRLHY